MPRSLEDDFSRSHGGGEFDLRGLGEAVRRRKRAIVIPTIIAFIGMCVLVNVMTPRYQGEALVLLENQESVFTSPDKTSQSLTPSPLADPEAVGSQIQLITSRDLAVRAIRELGLRNNPEFALSAIDRVMMLLGSGRSDNSDPAESRAVRLFQEKLTVFSPPKTRVITIQFQSRSAELAAQAANTIADLYLAAQTDAKRESARQAAEALNAQIPSLRAKVAAADAEREKYRSENGLLAGTNNLTISGQQLADINGELSKARTARADAQAKATLIRDLLRAGKTADVSDVINNELVRRVADQRLSTQAALALESRTLLPGHPRIQALNAQLAGLDEAMKAAAKQAIATLDNEAKFAGQRVGNLESVLAEQKKVAGDSNIDEVRLRSLDRVAQTLKDQLESSMAKYQEALARQMSDATPADARIIARAGAPQDPVFPKKVPFVAFGTIAVFVLACGLAAASELLAAAPPLAPGRADPSGPIGKDVPPGATSAPPRAPLDAGHNAGQNRSAALDPDAGLVSRARRELVFETAEDGMSEGPARRSRIAGWFQALFGSQWKTFGESAEETRARIETSTHEREVPGDLLDTMAAQSDGDPGQDRDAGLQDLAGHIVATHVPGRGIPIVAAPVGAGAPPADETIALARLLSQRGRTVAVDLNASPGELAPLVDPGLERPVARLAGLSELLAGEISFAEAIYRDHASRLHFIPAGKRQADFRDFDLILEALAETYDFVILLAPPYPDSEIAAIMAPHTDFAVLTGAAEADARRIAVMRKELIEAGAREVLATGQGDAGRRSATADTASSGRSSAGF